MLTVFQTSGITALLGALTRAAAATNQITAAQARLIQTNLTLASTAFSVFQQFVRGAEEATKAYVEFGNEVMNIRDLTGSTAQEAARAATLFRIAGVSDTQQIREILHLSQAVFSSQGRAALARIGVPANPNQTGLALFNQIADHLNQYQDGLYKAQAATEIFGARSVGAILPLLRLTKEQRERALALGDAYDTGALPAVQAFQFATANLGETIQVKLIYPLVEALLPAIIKIAKIITFLVDEYAALNMAMGGSLSVMLAFAGAATGILALVRGIVALRAAFVALIGAQRISAALQAFQVALTGPRGLAYIAAAAAATGVAIYGINKLMDNGENKDGGGGPADRFGKSVDKFDAAVNEMQENWQKLNRGGIPGGIDSYGADALARAMALGAIG